MSNNDMTSSRHARLESVREREKSLLAAGIAPQKSDCLFLALWPPYNAILVRRIAAHPWTLPLPQPRGSPAQNFGQSRCWSRTNRSLCKVSRRSQPPIESSSFITWPDNLPNLWMQPDVAPSLVCPTQTLRDALNTMRHSCAIDCFGGVLATSSYQCMMNEFAAAFHSEKTSVGGVVAVAVVVVVVD